MNWRCDHRRHIRLLLALSGSASPMQLFVAHVDSVHTMEELVAPQRVWHQEEAQRTRDLLPQQNRAKIGKPLVERGYIWEYSSLRAVCASTVD